MEAMYINSKPHALLPEDRTQTDGHRPSTCPPASDAGLDSSGFAAATPALCSPSSTHLASCAESSSATLPAAYISSSTAATPSVSLAAIASQHAASFTPPRPPAPSLRSSPAALPSSRRGKHGQAAGGRTSSGTSTGTGTGAITGSANTNGTNGTNATTGTTAGLPTPFPPLFFGAGTNTTTPATSLVGARGKSIPLDDTTAAHRTSALRELNSNFPSPVYRHRYAKPASAENSTYSQPVIVRTYSGPPRSASSSTHYRPPSSHRTTSRAAAARRIPLPPAPSSVSASARTVSYAAGGSSKHAPASSVEGVKDSLLGMARSKVKKGLLPWQWTSGDVDGQHQDDPKLPPMEAFSYKGFMAELQATTDIRADLDRIAEICARSHYSLSNQYDAHVAPHGSGTGFITSVTQRSNGRKKPPPGAGGPTLQAVPSDDDETGSRGARRRRGGAARNGRRQSAAYGTLETIMSSSRSSEEDKTKKKSAAEIAEGVRGRAVRKATGSAIAANATETDNLRSKPASKSPSGSRSPGGGRRGRLSSKNSPKATSAGHHAEGRSSPTPDIASSVRSSGGSSGKRSRRRKSTFFAHAVMDTNKQHRSRSAKEHNKDLVSVETGASDAVAVAVATVALHSDPALPQTSRSQFEIRSSPSTTVTSHDDGHLSNEQAGINGRPVVQANGESFGQGSGTDVNSNVPSYSPDEDAAGFFSGLGNWFPWMATTGPNQSFHPKTPSQAGNHQAEGSLRELLKNVDNAKLGKGKAVVSDHDD